jgi:hypothetical protein
MTPEDKAKELLYKMVGVEVGGFMTDHERDISKTRCILCCDEIIWVICDCSSSTEPLHFWQQVKSEIQKL